MSVRYPEDRHDVLSDVVRSCFRMKIDAPDMEYWPEYWEGTGIHVYTILEPNDLEDVLYNIYESIERLIYLKDHFYGDLTDYYHDKYDLYKSFYESHYIEESDKVGQKVGDPND